VKNLKFNTLYDLRLKEKWNDFVYIMLDSDGKLVNRVIAEKLDINIKTSQAWRHKFLSALNQTMGINIDGAIEMDEVILPFKVKGNIGEEKFDKFYGRKSILNVPSQLRLDEIDKQENKYKTFFMCIHNRQGDFDFLPLKIQPKGTVASTYIADAFDELDIKDKTVITIAHRLSTVKNANMIYVLDDGCLVQKGTHLELDQQEGHYKEFVKNQLI